MAFIANLYNAKFFKEINSKNSKIQQVRFNVTDIATGDSTVSSETPSG